MKKIILIITALFFSLTSYSQTPEKFTYQSIVRSEDGSVLKSAAIGIRLSILKSSKNGITVYSETHSGSTNSNGLFTLIIGDGVSSDTFSDIDWSTGEYFLRIQVDPAGGIDYSIEQTSQLLSVPYALYAGRASGVNLSADVKGVLPVSKGGTGSSTSPMIGVVTAATAADARQVLGIIDPPAESAGNLVLTTVAENYLKIKDITDTAGLQEITAGKVPISLGGTGSTTAPMVGVITAADAAAARGVLGIDGTGSDNSTPVTLASVTGNYLTLSDQEITAGIVPISLGGTGEASASAAREALGLGSISTQAKDAIDIDGGAIEGTTINNLSFPAFDGEVGYVLKTDGSSNLIWSAMDAAGTDNSTAVTLATVAENYLTLSGQEITVGRVPISLGGTGAITKSAARDSLGLGSISTQSKDAVDIDGGAIDGTAIGATTASTGAFSTISLGSTAITSTGAEINILDGDTDATATTVVAGDRVILNDDGTMKQVAITDIGTYLTSTLSLNSLQDAMYGGTNFSNSLLIGHLAHGELNEAENNLGVGKGAVAYLTSGDNNVGIGLEAGYALTEGLDNVFLGYKAGDAITTGNNNILIGSDAAASAVGGTNQIVIGKGATGIADNTVTLGNGSITNWVPSDNNEVDLGSTTKNLKDAHLNGEIRFYEDTGNGSNYVGFKSASTLSADKIWVLPLVDGSSGEVLKTDGSGTLSWVADSSGASALTNLSDVLIEATSSMYIGNDPSGTTDGADYNLGIGVTALDAITTGDGNIAVGHNALTANNAGSYNTASGSSALLSNTTGNGNTASGYKALYSNTTGSSNTASGFQALYANTTGNSNTASGIIALTANTTGNSNTASGIGALSDNTTGNTNTALGASALSNNTTGNTNIAIGSRALYSNTTASYNIAIGLQALEENTTGTKNIAIGQDALDAADTESNNIAIGYDALGGAVAGGEYNIAIGNNALDALTSGDSNIAVGHDALTAHTTGHRNLAIGIGALDAADTENDNIAIGYDALGGAVAAGEFNVAIGNYSLDALTAGDYNVAVGDNTLSANTTGNYNTATGGWALNKNTEGNSNTAIGLEALTANTTGDWNTAIGVWALYTNVSGDGNTAIGSDALEKNTASYNTAIGLQALEANVSGAGNTAVGSETLQANTASYNTAIGTEALTANTTGTRNIAIGYAAYKAADVESDNLAIGYDALGGTMTGGIENIAIGNYSMDANVGGDGNIAIGYKSLSANVNNSWNTAIGHQSLLNTNLGGFNTGVGAKSLETNTSGINNTAVGANSLYTNDSGDENTGVGRNSLYATTGSYNTSLGWYSGNEITSGTYNTIIGHNASASGATAVNQTVIGAEAIGQGNNTVTLGDASTTDVYMSQDFGATVHADGVRFYEDSGNGTNHVGFNSAASLSGDQIWTLPTVDGSANQVLKTDGSGTLSWTTDSGAGSIDGLSDAKSEGTSFDGSLLIGHENTGSLSNAHNNTGVGLLALDALSSGDYNVAIGYNALGANTTGNSNTASGTYALLANTTGTRNIAIGYGAYDDADEEDDNLAIGYDALGGTNAGGEKNIAIGNYSLDAALTADGDNNVAIGYQSLTANTSGDKNVAIGSESLSGNTDGERNTAVGGKAMYLNQTGVRNAAFGYVSGKSGDQNASFGAYSLTAVTGNNNTAVGYYAGAAGGGNTAITSGTNNVILGHEAGVDDDAAANRIVIGQGVRGLDDNTVTLGNGSITNWVPTDDDEVSLGSSSKEMDNIYVDGVAFLDAIDFGGTALTLPGSVGSDGQVLVKAVGSNTLAWTSTDGGTTLAGLGVSATAAELNIMDGNASTSTVTVVDADNIVINDGGTGGAMKQIAVSALKTYVGGVPSTIITPGMIDLSFNSSGASKIKKGGWNRPAIELPDATSQLNLNFPLPSAYTPDGSNITVKVLYSSVDSGDISFRIGSARTAIGESAEDGTNSSTYTWSGSATANYLLEGSGTISIASGTRMLQLMIGRQSGDANTDVMHIYGAEIVW